jgi:hypothetical protein
MPENAALYQSTIVVCTHGVAVTATMWPVDGRNGRESVVVESHQPFRLRLTWMDISSPMPVQEDGMLYFGSARFPCGAELDIYPQEAWA